MAVTIDPGYGYSNTYTNQASSLYIGSGDSSILVTSSTPYTASGVINSSVLVSGSGAVGTLYLTNGGTINVNGLTAGTVYPFALASASLSAGALYVIY